MNTLDKPKEQSVECPVPHKERSKFKVWMKRIGIVGFLFFLLKGLIWIAIFIFGAEAIKNLF